MADVSASTLILFIAGILVAASVSGVLISTVTDISNSLDQQGTRVAENIRTDVDIVSPSDDDVYQNGNVIIYIKNTGSRTLSSDPKTVDVLLDARYQTNVTFEYFDNSSEWRPGEVIELTIAPETLSQGDHHVTVILDGTKEEYIFRI